MTLGHTFSYIVSLPVSENVSGVAILAAFGEKDDDNVNTRTNLGVVRPLQLQYGRVIDV